MFKRFISGLFQVWRAIVPNLTAVTCLLLGLALLYSAQSQGFLAQSIDIHTQRINHMEERIDLLEMRVRRLQQRELLRDLHDGRLPNRWGVFRLEDRP